jgi:hypothetical protein
MEGADHLYPSIEPYDLEPPQLDDAAAAGEARVSDQPVRWDDEPKEVIELPLVRINPCSGRFLSRLE